MDAELALHAYGTMIDSLKVNLLLYAQGESNMSDPLSLKPSEATMVSFKHGNQYYLADDITWNPARSELRFVRIGSPQARELAYALENAEVARSWENHEHDVVVTTANPLAVLRQLKFDLDFMMPAMETKLVPSTDTNVRAVMSAPGSMRTTAG